MTGVPSMTMGNITIGGIQSQVKSPAERDRPLKQGIKVLKLTQEMVYQLLK